jgi:hypothetical protein
VEWNYGEHQAESDTEQTIPDAIILKPSDAWQCCLKSASPGETFLLREGACEVKREPATSGQVTIPESLYDPGATGRVN